MNIVQFGEFNSYEDFKLILNNKTITTPSAKIVTIDIPGGDGVLDYTEYFGEVKYDNRKLTLEFSTIVFQDEFLELFSYIQNMLQGKKMKIFLSDDPGFYYYGRIKLNEWKSDKRIGKLVIEVDAEPYKYKEAITTVLRTITASTNIVCSNLKKSVVPKITVNNEVSIAFGNNYNKTRSAGEYTDDEIIFKEGSNTIVVTPKVGSTTVKIEYQERGL